MKCKDLKIGDWVKHPVNGELCKVVSLTSDIELDDGGFYEEVEPIPLTTEILEKNFESLDMEGEYFGLYDDNFEVEVSEYTDSLWEVKIDEIEMSGLPSWRMYVSNLHELQHALRLCNIDWEIFPELKKSEGERIRKWLEELIEAMPDNSIEFKELNRIDVLHWLEKQGEVAYNPYKVTVKSIANMCDKYATKMNNEEDAYDFLQNVKVKCKDAIEFEQHEDKTCKENRNSLTSKLDAGKVIASLGANICDYEYNVKRFKKDFGL